MTFRIPKRRLPVAEEARAAPPVPAAMIPLVPTRPVLVAFTRQALVAEWPLERRDYTLGRLNDMRKPDLVFRSETCTDVSRAHARIVWRPNDASARGCGYFVEDLGSKHGTWLNSSSCTPRRPMELADGDVVWFGRSSCARLCVREHGKLLPPDRRPPTFRAPKRPRDEVSTGSAGAQEEAERSAGSDDAPPPELGGKQPRAVEPRDGTADAGLDEPRGR